MRIWTATILPCKSVRSEDMDYHNSSFQISAFRGYGLPQFFLATQSSPRIWITTILPCNSVRSEDMDYHNSSLQISAVQKDFNLQLGPLRVSNTLHLYGQYFYFGLLGCKHNWQKKTLFSRQSQRNSRQFSPDWPSLYPIDVEFNQSNFPLIAHVVG